MSTETLPLAVPLRKLLPPLAAYGLAGSVIELPAGPFAPDEWFELVRMCQEHGLLGMLAAAARGDAIALSTEQVEELELRENEAAAVALLVEQQVVRLSSSLTEGGVDHRWVGAAARARVGYRQSGIRLFEIATILVEPRELDVTVPRSVTLQPALPLAPGRTIDVERLSQPPTMSDLAVHQVPTVSFEEHLVLACVEHAALQPAYGAGGSGAAVPGALVVQRDVAELALSKGINGARVQQTAEAWEVTELVANALAQTWDLFRLADRTRLSVWARRIADSPVSQRDTTPAAPYPSPRPHRRRQIRRLVRKARKLTPSRVVTELATRWPRSRRSKPR